MKMAVEKKLLIPVHVYLEKSEERTGGIGRERPGCEIRYILYMY